MTNIALLLLIIMVVLSVAGVALFGRDFPAYFGNLGEGKAWHNYLMYNLYKSFYLLHFGGFQEIKK